MSALTSSRPSPAQRPSYAAVLRLPHARRTFLAALAARLSYGTVSLAVLLSVTRATGSYAVTGLVMALFGGSAVVLMPVRATLVDRYGPRRALPPMAAAYSAVLCLLAALTWHPGAPPTALALAAALSGCVAPPLGPTMRAVWGRLADDPALLRRAYSLDGVAEELLYVSGPALVGLLLRFGPPPTGLLLSAVLMSAGTCAFVVSPAVREVAPPKREAGRTPGGFPAAPVVAAVGLGLALSAVDLLVMAFAEQRSYGAEAVPWVMGALSAGSAVGGLLNGVVEWRRPAGERLVWLAAGLGATLAVAGLASGMWVLAGAMAAAGVFVAPTLTTAYLLADETAAEGERTRAGAWVNAAVNAGSSGGSVVAGWLVGWLPVAVCFALAGGVAVVSAVGVRAVPGPRAGGDRSRPRGGAA
ncbi:MFS transporter [Streptomyces sp. GbtcB6]|uniref:MFS transporter n=1 Tax=Streptomyces sp. GbtcB6 TaxID=2824751 RepID=UPI001C2F3B34|nr:MFS transporter [Streptomyces sp. GbtcB6]